MDILDSIINFIKDWYWVLFAIIYIGVVVAILSENRNPSKSIAYLLVLALLPGLGLIVFYFFGRDYRKARLLSYKGQKEEPLLLNFWEQSQQRFREILQFLEKKYGDLAYPAQLLYNLRTGVLTTRNQVKLLINGEEKFPEFFKAMEGAKHHIHLEYYIFTYDEVGKKAVGILSKKAREGIEVRVIIDGLGSFGSKRWIAKLRTSGAEVAEFLPVKFGLGSKTNYRNHRKILVVDGSIGFVGGINLDDRYLNNGKHTLYWRDTSLKLFGEVVRVLQHQFLMSWRFASGKEFAISREYFDGELVPLASVPTIVVASGPDSPRPYCMEVILSSIYQAEEQILITNPYFIPSEPILIALEMAASRGVDVQMLLPGKSDSFIVKRASETYFEPLLESGVKIHLYQRGFVHAKTLVVDEQLSIVGTVNLDNRSFYINFEIAAVTYEEELAKELNDQFKEDLKYCKTLTLEEWYLRSWTNRMVSSACRLFSPLL